MADPQILLYTDLGAEGPYLAQMEAAIHRIAPRTRVFNLLSNAPRDPVAAGYLLAALARQFPAGSIFVGVVDPGVGGPREALLLQAGGQWFVGPDNGLLNTVAVQSEWPCWWRIDWRPKRLSASFHGRDLFAPVAARIAVGDAEGLVLPWDGPAVKDWLADLPAIVYFDTYGNALSGQRFLPQLAGCDLRVGERHIPPARTFHEVAAGEAFWYENSCGLVEIAVNCGSAREALGLQAGDAVAFAGP